MSQKKFEAFSAEAHELLARIREERDELNLKMHLAKAEARDEWEKLEPKWEQFQARVHTIGESAGEASKDIGVALGILGEELRHGYERIRKAMHS
jgi:hypothetical protein